MVTTPIDTVTYTEAARRILFHCGQAGEPHHAAVVRNGIAHLCNADRTGRLKPGVECSCCRRCREFPHRTELEAWPEPHAGSGHGAVIDRNDDLRTAREV